MKKEKFHHQKPDACLNCGYLFGEEKNFCPVCGQENHDLKVPFKHMLLETLEGTLHLDSKIFTSIRSLVTRPGLLTCDFLLGKRVTHVPPIRLYVFISFLFFLILGVITKHDSSGAEQGYSKNEGNPAKTSFKIMNIDVTSLKGKSKAEVDSIVNAESRDGNQFDKLIARQAGRIAEEGPEAFLHILLKYFSYSMFFLMPVFALLLFMFNRGSYYIENLVFSVHVHSFIFLMLSVYFLSTLIYTSLLALLGVFIWGIIYLHKSISTAFPLLKKSVLRTLTLASLYFVSVLFVVWAVIFISIMMF